MAWNRISEDSVTHGDTAGFVGVEQNNTEYIKLPDCFSVKLFLASSASRSSDGPGFISVASMV